jgi:very-short-patch-repair endonuclease
MRQGGLMDRIYSECEKIHSTEKQNLTHQNYLLLKELILIQGGETKKKKIIRENLNIQSGEEFLNIKELEHFYREACKKLSKSHKFAPSITSSEYEVQKILRKYVPWTKFYTSFWIGNHCNDIFIPSYRLILSLEGSIHNTNQGKINKDNYRDLILAKEFKIGVSTIFNHDSNKLKYQIADHIFNKKIKAINYRSKKILMRNIYLYTIASAFNLEEISIFLNLSAKECLILKNLRGLYEK